MTRDEEIVFSVEGRPRKALVRSPERLAPLPGLLITLAADRRNSLDAEGVRRVADILLAAGHRAASFDLPNHGERANAHGDGLEGMAAAIRAGEDVFADIRETGKAFLNLMTARGLMPTGSALLNGISRGGLAALHLMAFDARALACAVHAPVTDLPTLREFRGMEENPIVRRGNAPALVERLAGRAVFIAIGCADARVSAERCFEFHARLCSVARRNPPVLFALPGATHAKGAGDEIGYQAAAGFLLQRHAEAARNLWPAQHP